MDVDEFDRAGGQGIGRLPRTVQCYVTTADNEPFIISYIMLNRHTLLHLNPTFTESSLYVQKRPASHHEYRLLPSYKKYSRPYDLQANCSHISI
jgi:hypothetical protein